MATVDELRRMARDFYAKGRASLDPSTKRKLNRLAADYFRQADELQRSRVIAGDLRRAKLETDPRQGH